jgi:hypothetical protein
VFEKRDRQHDPALDVVGEASREFPYPITADGIFQLPGLKEIRLKALVLEPVNQNGGRRSDVIGDATGVGKWPGSRL